MYIFHHRVQGREGEALIITDIENERDRDVGSKHGSRKEEEKNDD